MYMKIEKFTNFVKNPNLFKDIENIFIIMQIKTNGLRFPARQFFRRVLENSQPYMRYLNKDL